MTKKMIAKPTLEQLTRKYFWEQKKEELFFLFFILFVVWSIAGVFFQLGWHNKCNDYYMVCTNINYMPSLPYWMMISGIITTTFWLIFFFMCWLNSNWVEAENRANFEFEKRELDRIKNKRKRSRK